jgi:hypothetical protein
MVDLTRDGGALGDACHRLRSRATLLVLGSIAFVGGLVLNWLVAVGIAPLLLTALPCVAMCALGLCMTRSSESRADISPAPPATGTAEKSTCNRKGD